MICIESVKAHTHFGLLKILLHKTLTIQSFIFVRLAVSCHPQLRPVAVICWIKKHIFFNSFQSALKIAN